MKKYQEEILEGFKKEAQDLLLSFRSEDLALSYHSEEAAQIITDAVEGLRRQRKTFLLSQVTQALLIKEELKWDFLLTKRCDPLSSGMILRSKGEEEGDDWICDYDIIDLDDEITMLCNGGLIESSPSEGIKALIEYAPFLKDVPVVEVK
jgi:hypothetical protein